MQLNQKVVAEANMVATGMGFRTEMDSGEAAPKLVEMAERSLAAEKSPPREVESC